MGIDFFFVWNGDRSRFFPLLFFFFSFFLIFHLLSFFLEVHLHFTFSYFYKYQKPHVTKSNLFRWIWVLRKERSRFSVCYYFSFDLFSFNRRSFSLHYELGSWSVHDIYTTTTVLFTRFYSYCLYSTLRTRIYSVLYHLGSTLYTTIYSQSQFSHLPTSALALSVFAFSSLLRAFSLCCVLWSSIWLYLA